MKVYKVSASSWHANEVVELEAARLTDDSVWLASRPTARNKRVTRYERYFDMRAEAVDYLRRELKQDVARKQTALDRAVRALTEFEQAEPDRSNPIQ